MRDTVPCAPHCPVHYTVHGMPPPPRVMGRPTRRRVLAAILGAIGLGLGLYLCVGGGGYYTFGSASR